MARFRKQPVIVKAEQLTEQITVRTLEGEMVGKRGDWVITGVAGEKYPCSNDTFRETYQHIGENNYRKRQLEVEAVLLRYRTMIETPGRYVSWTTWRLAYIRLERESISMRS